MAADQDENVRRHRESLEAFNRRDMDAIVNAYSEDITSTDHAQNQTIESVDGIRSWNQAWMDAFSDGRIEDVDCFGVDDRTVARFVGRGTNDGPLGPFEATNARAELALCDVARWRDGKIVEQHIYYDMYGMLAQLGHVPTMTPSE